MRDDVGEPQQGLDVDDSEVVREPALVRVLAEGVEEPAVVDLAAVQGDAADVRRVAEVHEHGVHDRQAGLVLARVELVLLLEATRVARQQVVRHDGVAGRLAVSRVALARGLAVRVVVRRGLVADTPLLLGRRLLVNAVDAGDPNRHLGPRRRRVVEHVAVLGHDAADAVEAPSRHRLDVAGERDGVLTVVDFVPQQTHVVGYVGAQEERAVGEGGERELVVAVAEECDEVVYVERRAKAGVEIVERERAAVGGTRVDVEARRGVAAAVGELQALEHAVAEHVLRRTAASHRSAVDLVEDPIALLAEVREGNAAAVVRENADDGAVRSPVHWLVRPEHIALRRDGVEHMSGRRRRALHDHVVGERRVAVVGRPLERHGQLGGEIADAGDVIGELVHLGARRLDLSELACELVAVAPVALAQLLPPRVGVLRGGGVGVLRALGRVDHAPDAVPLAERDVAAGEPVRGDGDGVGDDAGDRLHEGVGALACLDPLQRGDGLRKRVREDGEVVACGGRVDRGAADDAVTVPTVRSADGGDGGGGAAGLGGCADEAPVGEAEQDDRRTNDGRDDAEGGASEATWQHCCVGAGVIVRHAAGRAWRLLPRAARDIGVGEVSVSELPIVAQVLGDALGEVGAQLRRELGLLVAVEEAVLPACGLLRLVPTRRAVRVQGVEVRRDRRA